MANLTIVADVSRKLIKFGGVGVIGLIVFQWLISSAITAYRKNNPPYTPPTVRYGLLPRIVFPNKDIPSKNFTLELPNDSFPKVSDQAKVYLVYRATETLLALDEDTRVAKGLGFNGQPKEIGTGIYQWENPGLSQTLTMNVLEHSFTMKYPYENDQLLQTTGATTTKEQALGIAKNFLSQANKLTMDLEEGGKKFSYWTIGFDGLKEVTSLSDAHLVRVDFFRKETEDKMRIVSTDPIQASVSLLVSGSTVEGKKIVEANFKYTQIDEQSFSTYPIKTPEEVWNDLKMGNYWLASDGQKENVVIRKMFLAYYEPSTLTNFMQPIYVLEGDNNFVGYVTAVDDEMITGK